MSWLHTSCFSGVNSALLVLVTSHLTLRQMTQKWQHFLSEAQLYCVIMSFTGHWCKQWKQACFFSLFAAPCDSLWYETTFLYLRHNRTTRLVEVSHGRARSITPAVSKQHGKLPSRRGKLIILLLLSKISLTLTAIFLWPFHSFWETVKKREGALCLISHLFTWRLS